MVIRKRGEPHALVATQILRSCARLIHRLPPIFLYRGTQLALDAMLSAAALFLAYQVRFDYAVPHEHQRVMWAWMIVLPALRPLLMWTLGGYDAIWRYFNLRDAAVLVFSAVPATLVLLIMRYGLVNRTWLAAVPAGVILMDYVIFLGMAGGLRAFRRVTYEASHHTTERHVRAVLVGNDATLPAALRHVSGSPEIGIVGLLAPDAHLQGLRIGGFSVLAGPDALPKLLAAQAADLVLIADASLDCIGATVATATEFGVDVRLLPSAANVIRGDVRVSAQAKAELALSDGPIAPALPHRAVVESFTNRAVLITGAGGSIGSELCRQVASLPVSRIVMLDRDENSIFEVSEQLRSAGHTARTVPVVADVRDAAHMRIIFEQHRPDIVLHAAAYKHVPVMENNCCEAVLNNVVGTRTVAEAAVRARVQHFLMVSTDKAVRPTSVMGATKRTAEMLVQALAQAQPAATRMRPPSTRLACVRFGNVVGSRGSVAPIFLRQIAAGGPITITDEHMTRYFMTIPEAAQLVLQAATLGADGDIYMLDMGDPVKITALARKLIEMSGLRPEQDIPIRFVGARPGEKLTEELWSDGAKVGSTEFASVLKVDAEAVPADFHSALRLLERAAQDRDEATVLEQLKRMPIGFRPAAETVTTEAEAQAEPVREFGSIPERGLPDLSS